ncbi:hypothetical protein GUJ93_ZPchr0010g9331 [Zizania palustris]|uniref:Thioesterase domain-containing protein n=1 Tax=Zizania palustris TaxID=103762 RepID=A0A8J6BHJ9_ZIZPA|nr:hypothetical protein GUJ93_ZPchr0010g9331 [Zizania palustris]
MQQQRLCSLLPHAVAQPGGSGHRMTPPALRRKRPAYLGMVKTGRSIRGFPNAPKPSCCFRQANDSIAGVVVASLNSRLQPPHDAPSKNNTSNQQQTCSLLGEDKFFDVEMSVRDDELDEYDVVNNAFYSSYLHDCRHIFLENHGIGVDYCKSKGILFALSELNLKFITPLRKGDRFVVKTRIIQMKGIRLVIEHLIKKLPDHQAVLNARGTIVCLDNNYRPTRIFPELESQIQQFL